MHGGKNPLMLRGTSQRFMHEKFLAAHHLEPVWKSLRWNHFGIMVSFGPYMAKISATIFRRVKQSLNLATQIPVRAQRALFAVNHQRQEVQYKLSWLCTA